MALSKKILGSACLLIFMNFLSRIMGFLREVFVAAEFGTNSSADIFVAVITIPNLLLTVLGGALSAALIPIIIRLRNQGEEVRVKRLISSMFTLTVIVIGGLALMMFMFTEVFVDFYVAGFSEEAKQLTVQMIRIILPAIVAIGLISLFASILNAQEHFFVPSLGPMFYSLGVIIAVSFFAEDYGVEVLAVGLLAGTMFQLFLALLVSFKKGITFSPRIWWNEDIFQVGKLIMPILLGVGVLQINILVDRMLASTLPAGNLAALNYAHRITKLPQSIFAGALVLPLFPMIADKITRNDISGAKDLIKKSSHLLNIILLPIIGSFLILAQPIVSTIFQRGQFDAAAVDLTSTALIFYSFSILPLALREVITRAIYSFEDTWTPVFNSLLMVVLNITLMIVFVPRLGIIGIAGSTSVSAIFACTRLRFKLAQKVGKVKGEKRIWLAIWRNAIFFTVVSWTVYRGIGFVWPGINSFGLWPATLLGLAAGTVVYIYLTLKLNIPEVDWLKTRVREVFIKILNGEG